VNFQEHLDAVRVHIEEKQGMDFDILFDV